VPILRKLRKYFFKNNLKFKPCNENARDVLGNNKDSLKSHSCKYETNKLVIIEEIKLMRLNS